jgi:hypothetical protein
MATTSRPSQASARFSWRRFGVVLASALIVQLAVTIWLGDKAYSDVLRSLHFGRDLASGAISIHTHADHTKTFLGPTLWFQLYEAGGLPFLRLFRTAAFALLLVLQVLIGRRLEAEGRATAAALTLVAFYPGTTRNVVAGELDDMLASVLIVLASWLWLRWRHAWLTGLVLGVAFLFKFWAAVFAVSFVVHWVVGRRWRDAWWGLAAFSAPLLILDLVSGGVGTRSLLFSLRQQQGLSTGQTIAFRLFSTGILPATSISLWAWARAPSEDRRLLWLVSGVYLLYVLSMRDAHAVTFVMMACLAFSSFLVSEALTIWLPSRRSLALALALYVASGVAIGVHNLRRDTLWVLFVDEVQVPAFANPAVDKDAMRRAQQARGALERPSSTR